MSALIPGLKEKSESYLTDFDVLDDELLDLFLQEIARALTGLATAIPEQDEKAVRDFAHTLLGIGGVAGAPEVSVLGEELRQAAIAHDWPRCADLTAALGNWKTRLHILPGETPAKAQGSPDTLQGRILVVDDELANRSFLHKFLSELGAEVFTAENGEQALEMVSHHHPDLALVDVVMPGIQGYEVCERITQSPEMGQTSVIMVTAKSTASDVENAFAKGAFDYIRKPFHSRELLARVRNALTLKRNTDALTLWKSRMSRELEMAGMVQAKLFDPTSAFGPNYDYQVSYCPSQHIGGDMFDLLHLADGRCFTYLADVAGHGVGSALISTLIKGLIQEILSGNTTYALNEIGNELHRRYRKSVEDPELYATMLMVIWDPASREITTLSCGHHGPLVIDEQGRYLRDLLPQSGGMPIGMMPAELGDPYLPEDILTFKMPTRGTLFLYTDGISEALNSAGEECGADGLLKEILPCMGTPEIPFHPDQALAGLREKGYQLHMDDCTLMSIRFLAAPMLQLQGNCAADLEKITDLAARASDHFRQCGWPDASAAMVQLLIIEHGANVIKHGHPPANSQIFYRLQRFDRQCEVVLKDKGFAWDPTPWYRENTAPADIMSEHGRGLHLIKDITSHRAYYRRDHENCFVYRIDKNLNERLSRS